MHTPRFLAYHMIGLSTLDTGRLYQAASQTIDAITTRSRERFETIRAMGALVPSRDGDLSNVVREQGHFFVEDILAEDNRFVFLSVGKRYWAESAQLNFGFLFDAERLLLDHNAILRQHDLMGEYGDLLGEVVGKRTGFREPTTWSEEKRQALFAALERPDEYPDYRDPNEAYYQLLDAVQGLHYEAPGVIEAIAEFRTLARRVQQEIQMSGEDALHYLEQNGASGRCELLVPGSLPLSLIVGTIEQGKEIYAVYP